MKKLLAFISTLTLLTAACSSEPVSNELQTDTTDTIDTTDSASSLDLSVNDFEPPAEVERGMADAGPYEMRLLSARSEDGITWERDNVIISEQANVPDMTITDDGTIFLYYVGGNILGKDQTMAVALSKDNGATWTFKKVTIDGLNNIHSTPGDPDIALREDGTFRLYFTAQLDNEPMPSIQYADSTDGLNFTYGGKAFEAEGYMTIDSSAFYIDGKWMMNTFSDFKTEVITGESSDGGDTFELAKVQEVQYDGVSYFVSNPFTLPDGSVRFYSFQLHPSEFRSFITTDGLNWKDEGRVYLSYEKGENDLEGYYIKDPVVVQLPDDSYLMVYVTRAP